MKNVIITGSANGVGKAIANELKENNLILIDIDKENLSKNFVEISCSFVQWIWIEIYNNR